MRLKRYNVIISDWKSQRVSCDADLIYHKYGMHTMPVSEDKIFGELSPLVKFTFESALDKRSRPLYFSNSIAPVMEKTFDDMEINRKVKLLKNLKPDAGCMLLNHKHTIGAVYSVFTKDILWDYVKKENLASIDPNYNEDDEEYLINLKGTSLVIVVYGKLGNFDCPLFCTVSKLLDKPNSKRMSLIAIEPYFVLRDILSNPIENNPGIQNTLKEGNFNNVNDAFNAEVSSYVNAVYTRLMFLQFSEIQTTLLKVKSKKKIHKRNILNDTKWDIDLVDSHWFRELIVSGAFKVRGHWRLQPCGKERMDRKLIWIKEFQKKGYHRKAKVLDYRASLKA